MSNIEIIQNTRHGTFAINQWDTYVGRSLRELGEYCEAEVVLLKSITDKNSVVVSVGANIGALVIPLARQVKEIYALEPNGYIYNLLTTNLVLNEIENVMPMCVAAGNINGSAKFPNVDYSRPGNFGALSLGEGDLEVPVIRLVHPCNLLQIDAEGMEQKILEGASSMIQKHRPFLFVENDRADRGNDLIDYIYQIGYTPYWHIFSIFNPRNYFNCQTNSFQREGCIECASNMLCIPDEIPAINFLLPKALKGSFESRFNAGTTLQ